MQLYLMEASCFQARKYFGHLATLKQTDPNVWLCLSVCCAMADELEESNVALTRAQSISQNNENDLRIKFCLGVFTKSIFTQSIVVINIQLYSSALLAEKKKEFTTALDGYNACLNGCPVEPQDNSGTGDSTSITFLKDLKGMIYKN